MKRLFSLLLAAAMICGTAVTAKAADDVPDTYSNAYVIMDAKTGQVLLQKNMYEKKYPASITKILTAALGLTYAKPEDSITVSEESVSDIWKWGETTHLALEPGEVITLRDALYGAMVESANDCANAIAQAVRGSLTEFAALMNQKARDLGCRETWYITPNGLDAENEGGTHRTSARDLATVLSYAIKNEEFLKITETQRYSFTDCSGKRSFTAVNKNAFLNMMDGVLSGKTGFTGNAGYCYACALRRDGKTYVAALLGCGWPPNKSWKWSDARALMEYGLNHYKKREIGEADLLTEVRIPVEGGVSGSVGAILRWNSGTFLMKDGERLTAVCQVPEVLTAPLPEGAVVGNVLLYLEDEPALLMPVVLSETAEAFSLRYCVEHIFAGYFDISLKV